MIHHTDALCGICGGPLEVYRDVLCDDCGKPMKRNPKQYAQHLAAYAIDNQLRNKMFLKACRENEGGEFILQCLTDLRDDHNAKSGDYRFATDIATAEGK